jgi:type 1 glutamine amidotransferase
MIVARAALSALLLALPPLAFAQNGTVQPKPEDSELWAPVPKVVTPGPLVEIAPPSDAIRLFDGGSLDEWVSVNDGGPAGWDVVDGVMVVDKPTGNIETKRRFTNYQLHLEWRVPAGTKETGQSRGNSGLFLASTGKGDAGYELQIVDSYESITYVNGQAASVYKQYPPLVNAMRPQGQWQTYDVIWTAPVFNADGSVKSPAYLTAFHNGVLVQDNVALQGETVYIGKPRYKAHGPSPIKLQSHGDPSPPISFRNIWVRELPQSMATPLPGVIATGRTMRPEWMKAPNFPESVYDIEAPALPADLPKPAILIFGKTNGYREDDQIKASTAAIERLVRARGWGAFVTENAAVFNPEQLSRFDAVVFSSTSGDLFTLEQRTAFREWIEKGGGFVGLHGAGGDPEYAWRWIPETLIGAQFVGHVSDPQFRPGTIKVEDRTHPATRHLGRTWRWTEEYYSFAKSPRGPDTHVLATVDEKTYGPEGKLVMGADHPLIWWRCTGKGRVFYSALGHRAETYSDPVHLKMIDGAIAWAARRDGTGCD